MMRKTSALAKGFSSRVVARVLSVSDLTSQWEPGLRFLVRVESSEELAVLQKLMNSGISNAFPLTRNVSVRLSDNCASVFETGEPVQSGDVVAISDHANYLHVLSRETDIHHSVFLTNRCNSNCLMCSQPPTQHADSWLVDEAIQVAYHIRRSPGNIGFTGGEPLLLGERLRDVLQAFYTRHPNTEFDVLTNGRLLGDPVLAETVLAGLDAKITWMVPIYGHADFLHDFVVQSAGAFDQTIDGLLTLQQFGQPIQLRVVLIRPVLEYLPELCEFIGRNLPFASEVALMGCEPIGFALANQSLCQVDLSEWSESISKGVRVLQRVGVRPLIMNAPLCALPEILWPLAHQSISDWKRTFAEECESCAVRDSCSGLFAWHVRGWRPNKLTPVSEYQR